MESKPTFDVFLSHNSQDKAAVEAIAQRLEDDEGLRAWLDKWNLVPGEPFQEAIEQAVDASCTCAVFLGPGGLGPWENEEMRAALSIRVRRKGFRVIPVLLPGGNLPELGKLPPFLSRLIWVDFRSGLNDRSAFRRLVAGIRGTPPGRDAESVLGASAECPYRGLEVFEEAHRRFFFGRESMTQHIIEGLVDNRFLAILGASGSGKSSLMRAGVIPKLKSGGLLGSENWTYVTMTPGAHPLEELALSLVAADPESDLLENATSLLTGLKSDEGTLHLFTRLAISKKPKNTHVFLFIDQFEEIMTLCRDDAEREQFLLNLRYVLTITGGRVVIVITMRADFMGRAATHRNLAEMLSGHQFVVSPMDDLELRQVIEEPAMLVGLEFEKGLVERILEDVGHEPGTLPLLEDALMQLCDKSRDENVATLRAYQELGGVHGALAKRAEETYGRFSPQQKEIARRVLLTLTQPGEGVEDSRRRAQLNELWPDSAQRESVITVVERLVESRLLTISANASDDQTVDVVHEALIRGWPRLRGWIDEERGALRIHHQMTETAREWRAQNREAGFLYRGRRLTDALEWKSKNGLSVNELEKEFLDASHQAQRRERRAARARRWAAIGALSLALIAVGLYAFSLYRAQGVADRAQKVTTSRRLAARAMAKVKRDPRLATGLALEADRYYRTPESEIALRLALSGFQESSVFSGHTSAVYTAEFSPDGNLVVTASADNTARIWDAHTFQELLVLQGHGDGVLSAVFSPDGNRVLTASRDHTARIWEIQTGQPLALSREPTVLAGHGDTLYWASFSRDGSRAVTTSADTTARIWDARTGKELFVLRHKWGPPEPNDKSAVVCATFNRDGTEVITGTNDGKVHIWNFQTQRELFVLSTHGLAVNVVTFSRDGNHFVTGSTDGTARIWDAKTLKWIELIGHTGWIYGATFSPDGNQVVTASTDRTAKIWDAHTGKELSELRGHSHWVYTAVFSPDGLWILTASRDRSARIWRAPVEKKVFDLPGAAKILGASFSSSRTKVVTRDDDGVARIWDGINHPVELRGHTGRVNSARFSPDERLVVTAGEDRTARIWSSETGLPSESKVLNHIDKVLCASFSPDGNQVVTGSYEDYVVRIWDVKTGQQLLPLGQQSLPHDGHTDSVASVVFNSDGSKVATTSRDQTALIWDWKSRQTNIPLTGHRDIVVTGSFRPDGEQVVTGSEDRTAIVWDLLTGDPVVELVGHTQKIVCVAFSPDGKLVTTASLDGTVRIWDASTGNELSRWGHNGSILAVAWAGWKQIIIVGEDRMVRLYDCDACGPVEDLVRLAQARNPGPLTPEDLKANLQER
jgi:WD40 repeat protein